MVPLYTYPPSKARRFKLSPIEAFPESIPSDGLCLLAAPAASAGVGAAQPLVLGASQIYGNVGQVANLPYRVACPAQL